MKTKIKAIDSWWVFLVATAFLGPFSLPLLWKNPRWSKKTKVAGSFFVMVFTLFLILSLSFLKSVLKELEMDVP